MFSSAFCSLSVVGRTTMITPTPQSVSPQDIVRIYVPPAPPNEQQIQHSKNTASKSITKDSQPNSLPLSDTCVRTNLTSNNNFSNNNINNNSSNYSNGIKLSPLNNDKSLSGFQSESNNKNSIINGSGDLTPVHYLFHRSDNELMKSFSESVSGHSLGYISNTIGAGQHSTSSSRRGSLSRKSPSAMFDTNILMECSHMLAKRRLSNQSNTSITENRMKLNVGTSSENLTNLNIDRKDDYPSSTLMQCNLTSNKKIMTSFEQLAASRQAGKEEDERIKLLAMEKEKCIEIEAPIKPINKRQIGYEETAENYSPDDENYSYSYYNSYRSAESRQRKSPTTIGNTKKFVSESNIQYKSFSTTTAKGDSDIEYHALNRRRPNSSGNETSPFQFDPFVLPGNNKPTSIKEYKRFYSTSVDDDDQQYHSYAETDEEPKKSSDESSSSPNSKSVLNTPVNETIPLIQSSLIISHKPIYSHEQPSTPSRVLLLVSPLKKNLNHQHKTSKSYSVDVNTTYDESIISPIKSPNSSASQIPVAQQTKTKTTTPTTTILSPSTSLTRPSRIPLMHTNQKIMAPISPTQYSSSSSSPLQSPNDLNRILPPIEIVSNINTNNYNRTVLRSPPSSSSSSSIPTTPNGTLYEFGKNHLKEIQSNNGGSTAVSNRDTNTIRIKINQNEKNLM